MEAARKKLISVPKARDKGEELRASGYRMGGKILKSFYVALKSLEER